MISLFSSRMKIVIIAVMLLGHGCPQSWLAHHDSCYFVSTGRVTFDGALRKCASKGGYLVEVDGVLERNFLRRIGHIHYHSSLGYWLGASQTSKGWRWEHSRHSLHFTDWYLHEPNLKKPVLARKNCAVMDTRMGFHWNDVKCDSNFHFICETRRWSTPKTTTKSPHTTKRPTTKHAKIITTTKTHRHRHTKSTTTMSTKAPSTTKHAKIPTTTKTHRHRHTKSTTAMSTKAPSTTKHAKIPTTTKTHRHRHTKSTTTMSTKAPSTTKHAKIPTTTKTHRHRHTKSTTAMSTKAPSTTKRHRHGHSTAVKSTKISTTPTNQRLTRSTTTTMIPHALILTTTQSSMFAGPVVPVFG